MKRRSREAHEQQGLLPFEIEEVAEPPAEIHKRCADATRFFHEHGFKVNSFWSVEGWDPAKESVDKMIDAMKGHIDDRFDGIHLDMLNAPKTTAGAALGNGAEGAAAAVARMRDELHKYGQEKYGRDVMFAGNLWRLDSPYLLEAARHTDAVWTESFGVSDAELVRIERVGMSIGDGRPAWYHLQPDDDAEGRIEKLTNLGRALFSSCLFENAVFLCNYKYPVKVKGNWQFFYINPKWEEHILRYSKFAREHRDFYISAQPEAAVLVAFRPSAVFAANQLMDKLIAAGVNFNVLVYGGRPTVGPGATVGRHFPEPNGDALRQYAAVVMPALEPLPGLGAVKRFNNADDFLRATPPEVEAFLKIDGVVGAPHVIGRVMSKGKYRILHMKQIGYTDAADSLPGTGPLNILMYAPGVTKGFVASPDDGATTQLTLKRDGDRVSFTVPGIEYYSLVVLE